jgi:hypothetical protein
MEEQPRPQLKTQNSKLNTSLAPAIFCGLLLLLLAPRLWQLAELGATRAGWPWQLDFVEGINLNATLQLAEGRNIYRINGPEEFISAPYTPLYHILTLPFAWLNGPSLTGGRLITLLSTLGIAALLVYIVRKVTRLWWQGLVSGALWLSLGPTIVWSAFYKQDITAMMLDLAGLAVIVSGQGGRRIYWAALLFALAFFTKQSAITGAAAAGIWLLARDWGTGLRFGAALGAMVFVPFMVGNALLRGGLWEHWVGYHAPLPHDDRRWWRHVGRLVTEYWPLLTVTMLFFLGGAFALFSGGRAALLARFRSPWTPIALYAILGWVSSLTKLGYEGANYNHLLDGLLPSSLLAGLALGALRAEDRGQQRATSQREPCSYELRSSSEQPSLKGTLVARSSQQISLQPSVLFTLAIAALLGTQALIMDVPQAWYRGGWPSADREKEMSGIANLVQSTQGDMYSEDSHLLLKYGKRVLYDDASTFVPLANIGRWDDSRLTQSMRDRSFSLIILQGGSARFTPEGLRAFEENYYLDFPGSLEYYEPKIYPDAPQYSLACNLSSSGEAVILQGYSLAPGVAQSGLASGDVLRATLYMQPAAALSQDYASYLHVLDEGGNKVAGRDNSQTGALKPTTLWEPGTTITDTTAVPLPNNLLPGRYRLIAGMYLQRANGLNALKPQCAEVYGDAVSLGWVEVR